MKRWISLVLIPLFMVGCGLVEPKDTTPQENQPPNTVITTSPLEGSETTYLAPIGWRGEDSDGIVVGFYVTLDGEEWLTTANDSTFTFSSTTGAGDSLYDAHTISVAAVDDDGARDPSPPGLSFNSWTYLPDTYVAGVDSGAEIGQAATFALSGADPDDYIFTYSYGIDGEWIDEDDDGQPDWFDSDRAVFADPDLVEGAHWTLEPGAHTFSVRARDRALGADPTAASVTFTVLDGTEPETWIAGGVAGGQPVFVDGSAFSSASEINRVEMTVAADASEYSGAVHSYSYSLDGGDYSTWQTSSVVLLIGVAAGPHTLLVKARDTAGNEDSSPAQFDLNLLLPDLTDGLVVVHETRDGRGVRGSPTGQEVDDFYNGVLGAASFTTVYWDTLRQITAGQAGNASTILWHSDDYDSSYIANETSFLSQYLGARGTYGTANKPNLLVSGSNVLVSFAPSASADTLTFSDGDFLYDSWGLQGAVTTFTTAALYTAVAAKEGYPNLQADGDKLLSSWRGHLRYTWLLEPLESDDVLYTLASEDGTSDYEGLPVAVLHKGEDANYIVLSFPLYFMDEAAVTEFLEQALSDLES
jgi:hypothetical protein